MKNVILALALLCGTSANAASPAAAIPANVYKAAAAIKASHVRTIIEKVNVETPCDSEYNVKVQVKKPIMNGPDAPQTYVWETIKDIGVDSDGSQMEVCYE